LELAHLGIGLLRGGKPIPHSSELVYQPTPLVGVMGHRRLGNQPTYNSYRKKHEVLIIILFQKNKALWKKEN
jgi:hypothetical protein